MLESGGRLHAILRNDGRSGDLVDASPNAGFELVCLSWARKGSDAAPQRSGSRPGKESKPFRLIQPSRRFISAGQAPAAARASTASSPSSAFTTAN